MLIRHSTLQFFISTTAPSLFTANGFTVDVSTGDLTLLRELEVTKIVAGSGEINGNLDVGGNITPNNQKLCVLPGSS